MKIKSMVEYDKGLYKCVGYITQPGHSGAAEHALCLCIV